MEAQGAGRAFRSLGELLQASGFLALQVDYDGTGDSAGSDDDPGRQAAWLASVHSGVGLLRSAGARRACVVGLRMGATLAAWAAEGCDLEALVLWEPCESGRSFLREQKLLRSVYLSDQWIKPEGGPGEDEAPQVLGNAYPPETLRELADLKFASCPGPLARRVLAVLSAQRPARAAVLERLSGAGAEVANALETEDVTSVWPLKSVVPEATLGKIVSWLEDVVGTEMAPVAVKTRQRTTVRAGDREVLEEISRMGPHELFAVVTTPSLPTASATVLMLNAGRIDHTGPGRLWVDLARQWAAAGVRVARADVSGLGDSPSRPGRALDVVRPPEAVQDVEEMVEALCAGDRSRVVLVGLCSGAHLAVQAALAAPVLGVVALNVVFPVETPPGEDSSGEAGPDRPPARSRSLADLGAGVRRVASHVPGHHLLGAAGRRAADVKWWLLHHVMGRPAPAFELAKLVDRGVAALVVCGRYEGRLLSLGEGPLLARAQRRGDFRLVVLPGTDHTLLTRETRDKVLPVVNEWVFRHAAAPGHVVPGEGPTGRPSGLAQPVGR